MRRWGACLADAPAERYWARSVRPSLGWGSASIAVDQRSGTARRESTPPDTNDTDVGNLLVDEVGDADPRWELILIQLHARHDLAARPRRSVHHPGEQFVGDGTRDPPALKRRGPAATSRSGRLARSRRTVVAAPKVFEELVLVGEAPKRTVGDLSPGRVDGRSHGVVTHFGPPVVEQRRRAGVSSDMGTRVDQPPATKATTT